MSISLRRRPSVKKRRRLTLFGSILTFVFFCLLYHGHGWAGTPSSALGVLTLEERTTPMLNDHARLWRSLFHIIQDNNPHCQKKPDVVIPERLDVIYEDNHIHDRPDVLWVDSADVQRLKLAHQEFVNDLQLSQLRLVYESGTRGIVTIASEAQIPILLTQLYMLRFTGSSLPVEVFLTQPAPLTDHICTMIKTRFNASCRYYSTIMSRADIGAEPTPNLYKTFALLFSSFDEVLLLETHVWPVINPDHLFTQPPFADTGLVLWPDFWYASESPYYFSIADIGTLPQLHHKPSTHSGELMYAKSKHENSIMLAAYYNYYGPDYYYLLLTQGAPGEGEKESFGCAALALEEDFYWVKTMVAAIGRTDSNGRFLGSAMVQHDPIIDFLYHNDTITGFDAISVQGKRDKVLEKQPFPSKRISKPMFIHANNPPFDPRTIFEDHNIDEGFKGSPTRDTNGTNVRCWDLTPEQVSDQFRYDVEQRFWHAIRTVTCKDMFNLGGKSAAAENTNTCRRVEHYIKEVFER